MTTVARFRTETIGDATLILGDCREVLPTLERVDACVTDPPYGIGWDYESHDDTAAAWKRLIDEVLVWSKLNARKIALAVGASTEREAYIYANHPPTWRVCHYRGSTGGRCPIGFRQWEMVFIWGSGFGNDAKLPDFLQTAVEPVDYGHPCEKPESWGRWFVSRLSKHGEIILDPFMGSGTTGVACIKLGRRFIGIEIEEKYFSIACRRIEEAWKQPRLFEEPRTKPVQEALDL